MTRLRFLLWGHREQVFPSTEHSLSQGRKSDIHKNLAGAQEDWGRQSTQENTCISGSSGWAYSKWTRLNTWRVCRLRKACERNWLAFGVMKDQRLWKTLAVMKDEPRVWSSKAESSLNLLGGEWIFKISQQLTWGSSHCLGRSRLRKVWKKLQKSNK